MGIGQAPPRRYPPAGMLKSVLQALCEVNSFSVQEVIKTNLEQGQTLGEARSCCLIHCLCAPKASRRPQEADVVFWTRQGRLCPGDCVQCGHHAGLAA